MNKIITSAYFILSVLMFMTLLSCETIPLDSQNQNSAEFTNESSINVQHRANVKTATSSDNYTRLGAGYLSKKNYERAMLKLQKAITLNDQNATAYNYMGILYWRLEQSALADKNFKKSRRISPLNAAINHNYASFLCSQKQYKKASALFNKVFANPLYDRLSSAYQVSGDCDLAVLQLDSAEKKYKKALNLDKTNIHAMLGMAKLFYRRGNLKVAGYYFERFEQKSKHSPDSLWLGINIQRKLGDNNKLASYILELKNLYPDSDETLLFIEGKQAY
ncbi:MAG: type IV pilus biogenesis/stability protein PilW [Pseudomonadota bacterium]